ncbi:MAG TPA: hypothetical protein VFU07_02510 [Candidatus Lumbricidophila sp.]|nr:hypothetical protein [Candidatus Lumbricidophila sp.]
MKTVQLREYVIVDGLWSDYLDWWQNKLAPMRRDYGFTIEFAFGDPSTSRFTWAVSLPGDQAEFERIDEEYKVSPLRDAVFAGQPKWTSAMQLSYTEVYA